MNTMVGRKRAQFDHVSLTFDTPKGKLHVVEDVTYDIHDGDFIAVIGPSGCGKTTMMSMLAGFQKPTSGKVLFDGQPVAGPGPERGVIFQEYGVFPWLTVKQNIAFGLQRWSRPPYMAVLAARTGRAAIYGGSKSPFLPACSLEKQ